MAGTRQAPRLPPGRSEPVAVHRRSVGGLRHGGRRDRAGCSAHRRLSAAPSCSASASSACSTPCSAGGRDVIKEAMQGDHTRSSSIHLRYGMILFIASEVMFFVAWFWAFFDVALFPGDAPSRSCRARPATGGVLAAEGHRGVRSLPPAAAQHADPAALGHDGDLGAPRAAAERPQGPEAAAWSLTVVLGVAVHAACRPTSTSTPAFAFTGNDLRRDLLHGDRLPRLPRHDRHDLPARLPAPRLWPATSRRKQHFGFEAAAWYWHFVDVVWLFLFVCIYVWGHGAATIADGAH